VIIRVYSMFIDKDSETYTGNTEFDAIALAEMDYRFRHSLAFEVRTAKECKSAEELYSKNKLQSDAQSQAML
jgi:hypothetical protein